MEDYPSLSRIVKKGWITITPVVADEPGIGSSGSRKNSKGTERTSPLRTLHNFDQSSFIKDIHTKEYTKAENHEAKVRIEPEYHLGKQEKAYAHDQYQRLMKRPYRSLSNLKHFSNCPNATKLLNLAYLAVANTTNINPGPLPQPRPSKPTLIGDPNLSTSWKLTTSRSLLNQKRTINGNKLEPPYPFKPQNPVEQETKYKYNCVICRRGFGCSSDLKRHIMIHTSERPFTCIYPNCEAAFTRKFVMENQYKKFHGPLPYGVKVKPSSSSTQQQANSVDSNSFPNPMCMNPILELMEMVLNENDHEQVTLH